MKELLRLEDITKSFGPVEAVSAVSMSVFDGEFLTVLGPSGSGKTTILRMIAGFDVPTSGRILLEGDDIASTPVNKRPFNTVFQDYALFPHMTVSGNIGYGLMVRRLPRREIRRRVDEALDMVALPGYGGRYPDQLSGGQRQRVALARSLILRPRILLLDEPLGALDLALRKKMQITLKEIQERVRITFIHVTHDQEEALSISDRIAIIHLGVLQQLDIPKTVYFRPSNRFVAKFMGENNLIEGSITAVTEGEVRVATRFGELRSCRDGLSARLSAGDPVALVIRPENIRVVEGGDTDNAIDCLVVRDVFIGSENKLIASPRGFPEIEIMVKAHSTSSLGTFTGSPIRVGWRREDCWLIAGEKAEEKQ